tara:strand:- start:463 stop:651 length:189 start_codon:yes stop_codon:yes gene_type:complete
MPEVFERVQVRRPSGRIAEERREGKDEKRRKKTDAKEGRGRKDECRPERGTNVHAGWLWDEI